MKPLAYLTTLPFMAASLFAAAPTDYHDHLGLQLWSLRAQFKESGAAALDVAKDLGIKEVETYVAPGLTAAQMSDALKARGITAVSAHMGYDLLKKDINACIRDAQTLGVKYLICPWAKQPDGFTLADAHRVAQEFNTWGEACKAVGIQFGYHPHGFEFTPSGGPNGELVFDVLARETKPDLVAYEMDVFWITHAGQDPAKLLMKYSGRWMALHVKDMRKGAETGFATGSAPVADNVAVGAGKIDFPEILRTAEKIGVKYYFLEDETATPLQAMPESLKYLRNLKL